MQSALRLARILLAHLPAPRSTPWKWARKSGSPAILMTKPPS
jgi:hypothetical protein